MRLRRPPLLGGGGPRGPPSVSPRDATIARTVSRVHQCDGTTSSAADRPSPYSELSAVLAGRSRPCWPGEGDSSLAFLRRRKIVTQVGPEVWGKILAFCIGARIPGRRTLETPTRSATRVLTQSLRRTETSLSFSRVSTASHESETSPSRTASSRLDNCGVPVLCRSHDPIRASGTALDAPIAVEETSRAVQ
jgi:hypothetical protein